ncbi:hypothetical protein M2139_000166 [Enterococcus sp. PF1-24]|uniref:SPJ_0845 family protein n=1 Tax=unclassified Enterococcus TaxID=2608891 RepID=UPI002475778D|nr:MULTISPECIES: SPJ_0845 family protein [unclassified Enterococcus]MDH6363191.1 hypothetical protein [Enterococcus sp. PFB1-1]MDH6400285.1 hypothetical protein [Enterococcus sp. PF1-24]
MALKFEKTDDLDKLFAEFAIDPDKIVAPDEEINQFLKPNQEEEEKKKKIMK